jgi:hypothetical protein
MISHEDRTPLESFHSQVVTREARNSNSNLTIQISDVG